MTIKCAMKFCSVILATFSLKAGATIQSVDILNTLAGNMLKNQALAEGYNNVNVDIQPLDSRLSLPECESTIDVLSGMDVSSLGYKAVGLRCKSPTPWTVYIRAEVTASTEIPVLVASLNRDDIISKGDIVISRITIRSNPVGLLTDTDDIIGKQARRALPAGKALKKSDLKAPILVHRGQIVDLISGAAGLQVRMTGKALADAANGERVLVQNLSSKKRVEGKVLPTAEVLVN